MIARLAVVAVCLAWITGCASLKIEVGVLNPAMISELADSDRLEKVVPGIVSETDRDIETRFRDVEHSHYQVYAKAARAYALEAAKHKDGSSEKLQLEAAAISQAQLPDEIVRFYAQTAFLIKSNTAALRASWRPYVAEQDPINRQSQRRKMLLLLSEREQITRRFSDHVHRDMLDVEVALKGNAEIGASAKKAVQQAVDTQANATSQAVRKEIIDSGGLEHSPYAYIVASADKLHWAPRYNDTVARGMFGNTDIAIKAIGPVNFTIKGLSFNPADVAAMASKVTTQTVLLASQIAGVPVAVTGTPTGNGAALAQSSDRLSDVLSSNAQTRVQLNAQQDALISIAFAILRERSSIESDDSNQRREALDAILAVYDSHAARLTIPSQAAGD
jgi:hypothetical protein